MPNNRIRKVAPSIQTRLQAESALADVVQLTIDRNREQLLLDEKLAKARAEHEHALSDLNKQIDEKAELLQGWAEGNEAEFGKLKSLAMQHGTLGWRQSSKLKPLLKWTWDRVLAKLQEVGQRTFIRTKEEVNKDALRDAGLSAEELKDLGVRLVSEDTFFIEPKLEQPENRTAVAA